jgi:hypothetical protein
MFLSAPLLASSTAATAADDDTADLMNLEFLI